MDDLDGSTGLQTDGWESIMSRILIIEDDADLREGLSFSMQAEGYQTETAATAAEGWEILKKKETDLILLDCNLPDGSGFDLCAGIRQHQKHPDQKYPDQKLPILMLTARDTEMDEVKALELGMDDFMSKPFSLAVLKARVKKLLQQAAPQMRLVSHGIVADKEQCKIYKEGKEISCSRIEYQMLVYFMENAGKILSKEQILAHIWDSQGRFVDDNAVPVNIRRLRLKIETDPKTPERIQTVHGIGYVWKE